MANKKRRDGAATEEALKQNQSALNDNNQSKSGPEPASDDPTDALVAEEDEDVIF